MKKRICYRTSVSKEIPARIVHDGYEYKGTVTDISETGLYLALETSLPFDERFIAFHPFKSRLEMLIPHKERERKFSVKLK